jgi:hypothetical protein
MLAVEAALDDPLVLEALQPPGEEVGRDPVEGPEDLLEPADAEGDVAQDQDRPPGRLSSTPLTTQFAGSYLSAGPGQLCPLPRRAFIQADLNADHTVIWSP